MMNFWKNVRSYSYWVMGIGCIILAGWKGWQQQKMVRSLAHHRIGTTVLSSHIFNLVSKVEIQRGVQKVTLFQKDRRWVVQDRYEYLANEQELRNFLEKLTHLRILDVRQILPSHLSCFQLDPQTAYQIRLYGANEELLSTLYFGKAHFHPVISDYANGMYFTFSLEKSTHNLINIFLVNEWFPQIQADPDWWLAPTFPTFQMITAISLYEHGKLRWEVRRSDPRQSFQVIGGEPGEAVNFTILNPMLQILSRFRFQYVMPLPSDRGTPKIAEYPWTLCVEDWDGKKCWIFCEEVGKDQCLRVRIQLDLPSEPSEVIANYLSQYQEEQLLYSRWYYFLDLATYGPLLRKREEVILSPRSLKQQETDPEVFDEDIPLF